MEDLLGRLEQWYARNCDGSWEHQYGIRIDTLDNPGWRLDVELSGTPLHDRSDIALNIERSEMDWLKCRVRDGKFEGFGGPANLKELLRTFLEWAERDPS